MHQGNQHRYRSSRAATAASRRFSATNPRSYVSDNPPPIAELEWDLIDLELRICERTRQGACSEYIILGDTYPHDDLLQHCGATWCKREQLWKFFRYDHLFIFCRAVTKGNQHGSHFSLADSAVPDFSYEENTEELIGKIRKKFDTLGESTLTDLELTILFLSLVTSRQDIPNFAKSLLINFRNIGAIFCSDKEHPNYSEHMDDTILFSIKTFHALMQRILREKVREGKRIGSWKALTEYLGVSMKFRSIEELRVLYLDGKNRLIKEITKWEGTVDQVSMHHREIAKDCILLAASSVILVHNHPSGDAMPSATDLELTNKLRDVLDSIDVKLHDHVIIGKNTIASFRKQKFL